MSKIKISLIIRNITTKIVQTIKVLNSLFNRFKYLIESHLFGLTLPTLYFHDRKMYSHTPHAKRHNTENNHNKNKSILFSCKMSNNNKLEHVHLLYGVLEDAN